jgi:hypothetical protein
VGYPFFLIATTGDACNSFLIIAARDLKLALAWHIERDGARFRNAVRELLALWLSRLCASRTKVEIGGMHGSGGMMGMLWMRVSITVLEYSDVLGFLMKCWRLPSLEFTVL